ncbi:S-adenosylmethionine decarboxylase proenzyme-like [Daphnia pulicaria]|uniref:S-adenosylmethionine decarboxylase proenzyme-like n=1 Tax=Daphnia pulicaria TaxID=35523 RepID=UPI001EEBEE32|nr:S-adenosylmethionine decarboxylase proenzyme-like [Daphnia pulicaria]
MEKDNNENHHQEHYFEGVEKLLEVWFTRKDGAIQHCDLRKVPREKWVSMLKIVRCEIISMTRNDTIDAYVLSESSMFVSKRRIILKTCGTTTPLLCLKSLLYLVQRYAGYDEVQDLFYSRKNYKRPELQQEPHRTFADEAALLDAMFHDGAAYCLGAVNRDCWYLYTLNPYASPAGHSLSALLAGAADGDDGFGASDGEEGTDGSSSDGGCDGIEDSGSDGADSSDDSLDLRTMNLSGLNKRNVSQRYSISLGGGRGSSPSEADQTLEIMMSDLDPEVMKIFTKQFSANAAEATQKSGIDKILPNVTIDDYLFDPCGYSMNGVLKNGEYMTIHITPEAKFSYVSFESNIPQSSYMDVIARVLETFRPGKFIVTSFANKASVVEDTHKDLLNADILSEFKRRDIQYCHLKNYDLTYALYSKFPS